MPNNIGGAETLLPLISFYLVISIIILRLLDHFSCVIILVSVAHSPVIQHNRKSIRIIELLIHNSVIRVILTVNDRIPLVAPYGLPVLVVVFLPVDVPHLVIGILNPVIRFISQRYRLTVLIQPALGNNQILAQYLDPGYESTLSFYLVPGVVVVRFLS